MAEITGGTPREEVLVAEINGQRYLVATPEQAGNASRTWAVQSIPAQGADPEKEFEIPLSDFSNGGGFSFASRPGVYERSTGWDASTPNKLTTWPELATGQSITTTDYRGWLLFHKNYLYVLRGRYAAKYAIDDTPGAVWPIMEIHDFGSGYVVAGRPGIFKDKAYVPLRNGAGGALVEFHELTTVVASATEVQTVIISGTPTAGTYTLTFDGKTTSALAFNAGQSAVQAALRAIAGLELVTVVTTGSTPNYTHTITMTGAGASLTGSSPPQITATDSTTGGTHAINTATSTAGTADTWTKGPTGYEAACFYVLQSKLWRAKGNSVYSVSADPMTGGDWSAATEIGDTTKDVNDLSSWDRYLMAGKPDGLFSLDENLQLILEIPDLRAIIDNDNCIGMEYSNGYLLIPHKAGWIRWRPGAWEFVGPEQEGAFEGGISAGGWGRVAGAAPYGKAAYFVINDNYDGVGALGSVLPPAENGDRKPLVPHLHHQVTGSFEAVAIVSLSSQPVVPLYPTGGSDDSAAGTISWSNPGNITADDASYATAAAGTSHYLKGAFGFAIPSNATITGVMVEIKRSVG